MTYTWADAFADDHAARVAAQTVYSAPAPRHGPDCAGGDCRLCDARIDNVEWERL